MCKKTRQSSAVSFLMPGRAAKGADMKSHIIGGSGSGKTYLARRLAQEYDIPHVELDELQCASGATLLRGLR